MLAFHGYRFDEDPAKLAEAVIVDVEHLIFSQNDRLLSLDDLFEICTCLITSTEFGGVKLAHYTVKEYLVSERIKDSPARQFQISEDIANGLLCKTMLLYLLNISYPDVPQAAPLDALARILYNGSTSSFRNIDAPSMLHRQQDDNDRNRPSRRLGRRADGQRAAAAEYDPPGRLRRNPEIPSREFCRPDLRGPTVQSSAPSGTMAAQPHPRRCRRRRVGPIRELR